jgi:hypothetical protein
LKTLYSFKKQATIMRGSTVLSFPLQIVVLGYMALKNFSAATETNPLFNITKTEKINPHLKYYPAEAHNYFE